MSTHAAITPTPDSSHARRLFIGSCMALISTSVAFAVIGDIMGTLKTTFVLTNAQVGQIGGAALWGFTLSIIALGPLCDALGMRNLLRFAWVCHLAGPLLMITATGFWSLFAGALILALGNGTVEAACNPLVATVYPDRKTQMLNRFHVWFPGGIVIGGLLCFAFGQGGLESYKLRLSLILIPTLIYGILFMGQQFPVTERVRSGISFGGMIKATLGRPLFLVLFLCMGITASLELGPNRWIPAILQAGGMHGILVLVWISGLMALLRYYAGPIVHRLSPTGMLVSSAVLSGLGLFWLSYAETMTQALIAATVFALGVCYFWPTMLGVVSERVPRGGALALALMGGMGMLASGMIASPWLGRIADENLPARLDNGKARIVLQRVVDVYTPLAAEAVQPFKSEIQAAVDDAAGLLAKAGTDQPLPGGAANTLRHAVSAAASAPGSKEAGEVVSQVKAVLDPADNYGGRMAFRRLAPLAAVIVLVFGLLYFNDRRRGGYKVEHLGDHNSAGQ
jgi:MFS family permease